VVNVKPGYMRNFLYPKRVAVYATPRNRAIHQQVGTAGSGVHDAGMCVHRASIGKQTLVPKALISTASGMARRGVCPPWGRLVLRITTAAPPPSSRALYRSCPSVKTICSAPPQYSESHHQRLYHMRTTSNELCLCHQHSCCRRVSVHLSVPPPPRITCCLHHTCLTPAYGCCCCCCRSTRLTPPPSPPKTRSTPCCAS
jgi:hypothetical protein